MSNISFVESKIEFETIKENLLTKIDDKKNFENNPFLSQFKFFRAFDFDFLFDDSFIKSMLIEAKLNNQIEYYFYVLKPDPVKYFYENFQKYNVFKFSKEFSEIEFDSVLMEDPGNSPSDAIAINSFEIAIFSNSDNWCIMASRDLEIAIIGFSKLEYVENFEKSFENYCDVFYSVDEYVSSLYERLDISERNKILCNNIVDNYK